MMTIQREGQGFSIVSKETGFDGVRVFAENVDQLVEAVVHNYAGHPTGDHWIRSCPFCR